MKHVVAFLSIGACLLLPSSGVVLAGNLHTTPPSSITVTGKGQTGANPNNPNFHACGGATGTTNLGPSAGAISAGGSVFNPNGTAGMMYAGNGANTNTPANSAAVSQYDVACFQAP
jgi:hypothetical protein